MLVLDQADLLHDRTNTLRRVFSFLGVEPDFELPAFARIYNTRGTKVIYNRTGAWLVRHGLFTRRRGPLRRGPLIRPLRAVLSRPVEAVLPEAERRRLVAELRPEVEWLREVTGNRFATWAHF